MGSWGRVFAPQALISAVISGVAVAEPNQVVLGIGGAATYVEERWDATMSARLAFIRDGAIVGRWGVTAAASRYTDRDGGRASAEVLTMPWGEPDVGLSTGLIVELGELHHPRIGATGAIWTHQGVVPYLRVGVIESAGGFLEAGLEIPIPVLSF